MLLISPDYVDAWVRPPTSLGWIAAALERAGEPVELIDCRSTNGYRELIAERLRHHAAVGLSVTAGSISSALEISRLVRRTQPSATVVMGGPHPTAVYERLIPKHADVVVLGEGDDTIVDVLSGRDLARTAGVAYWDGALRVNPRRGHIQDLDRLGLPAWHHYRFERYCDGAARRPFAIITTSRGCPYRCAYCTKDIHGYDVRMRSLDGVIAEIDRLVRGFGIREIQLGDDALSCFPDRMKQLCRMIIARRYPDLRFSLPNGMRPDHGDEELFRLLAEAGAYSVTFGFESGSREVLEATGKALSLTGAERTVRMARAAGLLVRGAFMIGLPGDTADTIQSTIDLARRLPLDNASFSVFVPFPGTESYARAERTGRLLIDLTLTSATPLGAAVFETPSLRAETVDRLRRKAHRQFFLRPRMLGKLVVQGMRSPAATWGLVRYGAHVLLHGGAYPSREG